MQKKIQITSHGVATIYHEDALQFIMQWKEPMRVHKSWIDSIERVAANCPLWPIHMAKEDFWDCYRQAPNLAAALLNFLREKWGRLEKSKAGKLKKYLSQNPTVKWDVSFNSPAVAEANRIIKSLKEKDNRPPVPLGGRATVKEDFEFLESSRKIWAKRTHFGPVPDRLGNVPIWDLQDKQIKTAIEQLPWGKGIRIDDVVKARQWVVANQTDGKKFAEKVLDQDGFLQVKARPCRRR